MADVIVPNVADMVVKFHEDKSMRHVDQIGCQLIIVPEKIPQYEVPLDNDNSNRHGSWAYEVSIYIRRTFA